MSSSKYIASQMQWCVLGQ